MNISFEREYTHKIMWYYDLGQLYLNEFQFLLLKKPNRCLFEDVRWQAAQRFKPFQCTYVMPDTPVALASYMF
jgi:hypothetical protein